MDSMKTGRLIRILRLEQGLTQRALAEKLQLSDKTISKWERGLGIPDVSLLAELSRILGADIGSILSGSLSPNETEVGNMKNTRYFVCPVCGGAALATGNASLSCCGRTLAPLPMQKAAPQQKLQVEAVEDEWYITGDHPMEKDNYIAFVAFQTGEKVEFVRQYPEWNLQLRIKRRGHGKLIWYSTSLGLMYQLL